LPPERRAERDRGQKEEWVSVRYIGSKARVAQSIVDLAGQPLQGRFVDAFCGTGAVAAVAADRGWPVTINDSLPSAIALATGALLGQHDVSFVRLGGYEQTIATLNDLVGEHGFLHDEYSPASARHSGVERRYFTEANSARLDAMRRQVGDWMNGGVITEVEQKLLLADLMAAANRVANISGTYGCFLSTWTATALRPVEVRPRQLPERSTDVETAVGDVFDLETTSEDVVYFDPPYTKRQYAAYYHVLETLTAGDRPEVGGVTGLRPWQDKASDFCYKARALDALTRLVLGTTARKILLSYSNEGHVHRDHLVNALTEAGRVTVHNIKTIGRYRPNTVASSAGDTVDEYVIEVAPLAMADEHRPANMEAVCA
jgi:adenine-specific DNA-methyltransferase